MSKILLVEDNEFNRDMLSRRLLRQGFEVTVAEDGESGVLCAGELLPDLVLMDMSLPIMDGWEATRKLKSSDKTASIPIIGLSAHAMNGDAEKAMQAGCDDYDIKPVDFKRLLEKISRLIKTPDAN